LNKSEENKAFLQYSRDEPYGKIVELWSSRVKEAATIATRQASVPTRKRKEYYTECGNHRPETPKDHSSSSWQQSRRWQQDLS